MESELTPISREYWMPDSSTKACNFCERPFSALLRRHHCRICGLIYCYKCCEHVLTMKSGEEITRICAKCHQSFSRNEPTPSFFRGSSFGTPSEDEHFLENDVRTPPESALTPHSADNPTHAFSDELLWASPGDLGNQMYTDHLLTEACDRTATLKGIDRKWLPKLAEFVREAVSGISIENHQRKDEMDINAYLRIVKLENSDSSPSEFFPGVAFIKNIAHKKMKVRLHQPSVLILSGGAEFSSNEQKLLSMESILDQEPDFTKIFTRKLAKLKPSLVIVERSMSQWIISELARVGITAIINVKMKVIEMIARVTHGKILSDIDQATQTKNCIGHCLEFVVKPYKRSGIVYLRTNPDLALGGSIVLTGPDPAELQNVKAGIRELCGKYRNWRLESSLFAQFGMTPLASLSEEMGEMELTFHHLRVFEKMCQKPSILRVRLYSKDDTTLGQWILQRLRGLDQVCESCGGKTSAHIDYYLKKQGLLKVTYLLREDISSFDSVEFGYKCKICETAKPQLMMNNWSREYSFYRFVANYFIDQRHEMMPGCGHRLFKDGIIIFSLPFAEVRFQYLEKPVFRLLPQRPEKSLADSYRNLTVQVCSLTQTAGLDLLQKLLQEANHLKTETADILSQGPDPSVEGIKTELNDTYDEIILALRNPDETEEFAGILEAEYHRREVFLQICKLKVMVQAFKLMVKTAKMGKTGSVGKGGEWTRTVSQDSEQDVDIEERLTRRWSKGDCSIVLPRAWLPLEKSDPVLSSPYFDQLQLGCLTLPPGLNQTFTPVTDSDPLSIIAYVLNSQKHFDEVGKVFKDASDLHESIESELLSGSEFTLETVNSTYSFGETEGLNDLLRIYGQAVSIQVTTYYARQFHAIRLFLYGSSGRDFLQSILRSKSEQQNIGKSGARFYKTHDDQFIAKIVEEKEFQMFVDMAPNYFRHMCKRFYHNMPSRLVRTVGVFRIIVKTAANKNMIWLLVMENLGFGVNSKAVAYDLKGTLNSRRYVKEGEQQTKMDLNFIEDMSALPISLDGETMKMLESSLWNDTLFLHKQNVIDYSLVVLINTEDAEFAAGMIDYLRQYTFDKAIESKYKKVIANEMPTITNPVEYRDRFRTQVMQDYFLTLDISLDAK